MQISHTLPRQQPRWEAFAQASNETHTLEAFELQRVQLPPSPFFEQKLLPILNNNSSTLIRLQLSGCDLDSKDVNRIARLVKKNKVMHSLDLSTATFDSVRETRALSNAIKGHPELKFVNLSNTGLGGDKSVLKAVLSGVCNVESLILEENQIGSGSGEEGDGLALIADFIKSNDVVTVLSLADNGIEGKKKSEVLANAMKKNHTIQELSIGNQKIDIRPFLASKKVTDALAHLDLGGSNLRSAGSKQITAFLKKNPPLSSLNVSVVDMKTLVLFFIIISL